jgi:hypothetical protein
MNGKEEDEEKESFSSKVLQWSKRERRGWSWEHRPEHRGTTISAVETNISIQRAIASDLDSVKRLERDFIILNSLSSIKRDDKDIDTNDYDDHYQSCLELKKLIRSKSLSNRVVESSPKAELSAQSFPSDEKATGRPDEPSRDSKQDMTITEVVHATSGSIVNVTHDSDNIKVTNGAIKLATRESRLSTLKRHNLRKMKSSHVDDPLPQQLNSIPITYESTTDIPIRLQPESRSSNETIQQPIESDGKEMNSRPSSSRHSEREIHVSSRVAFLREPPDDHDVDESTKMESNHQLHASSSSHLKIERRHSQASPRKDKNQSEFYQRQVSWLSHRNNRNCQLRDEIASKEAEFLQSTAPRVKPKILTRMSSSISPRNSNTPSFERTSNDFAAEKVTRSFDFDYRCDGFMLLLLVQAIDKVKPRPKASHVTVENNVIDDKIECQADRKLSASIRKHSIVKSEGVHDDIQSENPEPSSTAYLESTLDQTRHVDSKAVSSTSPSTGRSFFDPSSRDKGKVILVNPRDCDSDSMYRQQDLLDSAVTLMYGRRRGHPHQELIMLFFNREIYDEARAWKWWQEHQDRLLQ